MKRNRAFAALLLAAATMMTVACTEKDSDTAAEPKAHVVQIWRTNAEKAENYIAATDTWTTVFADTSERRLYAEFFYTGDRLDSMIVNSQPAATIIHFTYDADGHLTHSLSNWGNGCYYYYTDGRLSSAYEYSINHGDTTARYAILYTWDGDHLQRYEEDLTGHNDTTEVSKHYTTLYTWNGNNVASTVCYTTDNMTNTTDTSAFNYEYSSIDNPFHGFPFWLTPNSGVIWMFNGIDGLCKNIPSHIYSDVSDFTFEHTTSSGRIATVTERQLSVTGDDAMTIRITSENHLEFEYDR